VEAAVRIDLVAVAYNSGPTVEQLVASARSQRAHQVRVRLFLHSSHAPTVEACERIARAPEVTYYAYKSNRGLGRSWNDGILDAYADGAEVVIIANDDIRFSDGDLDRLAEKAAHCVDRYIITCAGPHERQGRVLPSHGYSCFAVNRISIDTIGCFDENFFPAYYEDLDYARRAGLAGLAEGNCPDTAVTHEGSATIRRDPGISKQTAHTLTLNSRYYARKWGGEPGRERHEHPFGDPALGLRIAPDRRRAPYGTHDRADLQPLR
jgi:GT2 family glycosyltransferase